MSKFLDQKHINFKAGQDKNKLRPFPKKEALNVEQI
jgi:hypothetical protein